MNKFHKIRSVKPNNLMTLDVDKIVFKIKTFFESVLKVFVKVWDFSTEKVIGFPIRLKLSIILNYRF